MAGGPLNIIQYYMDHFEDLSTALNSTDNIYAATVGPPHERCIIFLSKRMAEILKDCKEVFTSLQSISAAPPERGFLFVYQISCISAGNNVKSLLQALLETPTYEAIRAILLYLQESFANFKPIIVNLPYSRGERAAWEEVFGCETHFTYLSYGNALLKKIAKLQLANAMQEDLEVQNTLRSFLAIPLLPQSLMHLGVSTLIKRSRQLGNFDMLAPFFNYFLNTWMEGPWYDSLSVYSQGKPISNVSDVATQSLNRAVGNHYPNILDLIDSIRPYEWSTYRGGQKVITLPHDTIVDYASKVFVNEISVKRFLNNMSSFLMEVFF